MMIYSLLALICSIMYSASAVLCKYGLQHNPRIRELPPKRLILALVRNKFWLFGVLLAVAANISMIQIQSKLDVSIVYSILNFSYIFVLVLGHYLLHEHLNSSQWLSIVLVVIGTVLILSIRNNHTGQPTDTENILKMTGATFLLIVGLVSIAWRYRKLNYEIPYAFCAGICFACVEVYLKAITNMVSADYGEFSIFSVDNMAAFVTNWPFIVMFAYGAFGWLFLQITYSHGNVSVSVPIVAVTQRILSMLGGYFVYDEIFGPEKLLGVVAIVAGIGFLIVSTPKLEAAKTA